MAYGESYEEFVAKFQRAAAKTTDDCYTPPAVYEVVKDWAVREYGLQERRILRPFYPGGDYEAVQYEPGDVVIDNPPFSIVSQIVRFYEGRGIDYFLFAPTLTLFSVAAGLSKYLVCGVAVTYDNGARVSTSFVTSLGEYKIFTAPELVRAIKDADAMTRRLREAKGKPSNRQMYKYPAEAISAAVLQKYAKRGFAIGIKDAVRVRNLDAMRAIGKELYGGGFLISSADAAALEAAAAEAAEAAAAEAAAAVIPLSLSERERDIVRELDARQQGGGRQSGIQDGGTEGAEPKRVPCKSAEWYEAARELIRIGLG